MNTDAGGGSSGALAVTPDHRPAKRERPHYHGGPWAQAARRRRVDTNVHRCLDTPLAAPAETCDPGEIPPHAAPFDPGPLP